MQLHSCILRWLSEPTCCDTVSAAVSMATARPLGPAAAATADAAVLVRCTADILDPCAGLYGSHTHRALAQLGWKLLSVSYVGAPLLEHVLHPGESAAEPQGAPCHCCPRQTRAEWHDVISVVRRNKLTLHAVCSGSCTCC